MGGEKKTQKPKQKSATGKMKGKDVFVDVELDFMEAINGTQKHIAYNKTNQCGTCHGTKMRPGTEEEVCGEC